MTDSILKEIRFYCGLAALFCFWVWLSGCGTTFTRDRQVHEELKAIHETLKNQKPAQEPGNPQPKKDDAS